MITMNPKEYFPPMHTAEHILNSIMVKMFDRGRSFSNHIEKKKSKCDYHFDRNLTSEEIGKIETDVNFIINKNIDITEEFIPRQEAGQKYNLINLPDQSGETMRIIHIGEYDSCPCSGVHVKNTSDIGAFKIISTGFDNNVLRIRFKLDRSQITHIVY